MSEQENHVSSESEDEGVAESKKITSVDLGLIESDPSDDAFDPLNFPCKIGGKPVWLDPKSALSSEDTKCGACSSPMVLLAQLYCPLPNRETDAYHRTIYVFMCPRRECCAKNSNKSFAVFRSQLPENNPIYPGDDATEEVKDKYENQYYDQLPQLCEVCGIRAPFQCAKCKDVSYCCRLHQTQHWHQGGHKLVCGNEKTEKEGDAQSCSAFPEFEVYIKPEPAQEKDLDVEQQTLDSFTKEQTETEETDKTLESEIKHKQDPAFSRFLRRIQRCPSQIIRYDLGASNPLWPASCNIPDLKANQIPPCQLCGVERQFEFQIMPQLLNYLPLDDSLVSNASIDWATLAIYTCSANCPTVRNGDKKQSCCANEFLWKQDYADN